MIGGIAASTDEVAASRLPPFVELIMAGAKKPGITETDAVIRQRFCIEADLNFSPSTRCLRAAFF
jgi:hypothetical protein